MRDDIEIPETLVFSRIRSTDKLVDEQGKKRADDNPGGFVSFTGISPINITEKSVGKKIDTQDGEMTVSRVWREGKAGEAVTLGFKERDEE